MSFEVSRLAAMEPVTLSLVVAALVAKAVERAEDRAVDGAEGALAAIAGRVRRLFVGSGDVAGERVLELVETVPDSDAKRRELAEALGRHLERSPDLVSEFAELVRRAEDAGIAIGPVTQSIRGDGNTQIGAAGGDVIIGREPRE